MISIHETAVVDPRARVSSDVEIGPYTVIGPDVTIGRGSWIGNHVTIMGHTKIGAYNRIFPNAVIGAVPQDRKFKGENTLLEIGDNNEIREFATIHSGTVQGGGLTRLGNGNLLMAGCHIAHDCILDDDIVIANNALLAGHIRVQSGAIINGAAAVHHFTTVGRIAFVGGLSRIVHDVPPFMIVEGNPSRVRGINSVGMRRNGIPDDRIEMFRRAYRFIYHTSKTRKDAMEGLKKWKNKTPEIELLLAFYREMERGIKGRALESRRRG